MSGGSYDYAYRHLEELARAVRTRAETELTLTDDVRALRHEFADRLELCAKAAHAIEWADSGDTSEGSEVGAIRAALDGSVAPREPESLDVMAEALRRGGVGLEVPYHGARCFVSATRPRIHVVVVPRETDTLCSVGVGATGAVATADAMGPRLLPALCAALRKVIIWCAENDERQAEDVLRRVLGEVARV